MRKQDIQAIVREHMADCAGISQRDLDDHSERIAFRLERMLTNTDAAGEALTTAIELVRRNMMPENHGTPIGNAVDFLVRTNIAAKHRNIAECGRLAREYALETPNV